MLRKEHIFFCFHYLVTDTSKSTRVALEKYTIKITPIILTRSKHENASSSSTTNLQLLQLTAVNVLKRARKKHPNEQALNLRLGCL